MTCRRPRPRDGQHRPSRVRRASGPQDRRRERRRPLVAAEHQPGVARLDVPEPYGAVADRRGDLPAIGAEGHGHVVAGMPGEIPEPLPRFRIPEDHRAGVLGAGRQPPAVWMEGQAHEAPPFLVRRELVLDPAGRRVEDERLPEADSEPFPVGAVGGPEAPPGHAQGKDLRRRLDVPDLDRIVSAAGNQTPTVGTEGYGEDDGSMTTKGRDLASGVRIPEPDRPVVAGRGEATSVAAEGEVVDFSGVAAEVLNRPPAVGPRG